MKKYIIIWLLFIASCTSKQEKIIQGENDIDTTLKVAQVQPHFDELITKKLDALGTPGNQRFGTYLTTGQLTQEKINSFRGFLHGVRLRFGIKDINTADNIYNYLVLDNAINICKLDANKLSLLFQMWRNPLVQAPTFWSLSPYSVPVVITDDSRPDLTKYYYYENENYIILCDKATNALAGHLRAYTTEQKQVIIGWLGSFGVTGDHGAYKGQPLDNKYIIPLDTFNNYWHVSTEKLIEANRQNAWLNIAINPNNNAEDWQYGLDLGLNEFKVGEIGHGYGASGEGTVFRRLLGQLIINPLMIYFSESEGVQDDTSWTRQDFFPLVASFLTAGGKILSVAATDNVTDTSLAFLNLYAGSTTGGYSYMRDALDYADSSRFKEAIYGAVINPLTLSQYTAQVKRINNDETISEAVRQEKLSVALVNNINPIRVKKIQDEYIPKGYLFYTNSIHNQDGGIDLWKGNYEWRLHQKSFEGYGLQRIGDSDGAFGRYAKAIQYAAWDSDDSTISEIKLTYFDNHASWNVRVANGNGATLLKLFNCTNTKTWKQVTLPVTNFKKRGINNNDVVISTVKGKCILQIIEVK